MSEALEIEIERAWCELSQFRRRRLFLTTTGKIVDNEHANRYKFESIEIGPVSGSITLKEFRDKVFNVFDRMPRHASR